MKTFYLIFLACQNIFSTFLLWVLINVFHNKYLKIQISDYTWNMSREFEDYISKIDIRGFVRETSDEVPNMQHVSDILGETQGHLQRITQSEIIFPDFLTLDAYPINQHAFQAMKELNQYHHSHVVSYRWKDHKIYAYMVLSGEKTSRKIQSVFSVSWNVWWDLIKKFLVDAPEKYVVSVDCPKYNILLNYMAQREWY